MLEANVEDSILQLLLSSCLNFNDSTATLNFLRSCALKSMKSSLNQMICRDGFLRPAAVQMWSLIVL